MMKMIFFLFGVAILSACNTTIDTVHDAKADFSQYKTFCWMGDGCNFTFAEPGFLNDTTLHAKIEEALIAELKEKGLTLSTDKPDLLIGITVTVKDEKAVVYHRSPDMPYYQPLSNDREVIQYLKGTLVIGMADTKTSSIVWESFVSRYMDLNPDLSEKNIRAGIHAILENYPPKD